MLEACKKGARGGIQGLTAGQLPDFPSIGHETNVILQPPSDPASPANRPREVLLVLCKRILRAQLC